MGTNQGGKRPGAGRKPKEIKLQTEIQSNVAEMTKQKMRLLARLHQGELIDKYVKALEEMLDGGATVKSTAARIITDVPLKLEPPKEIEDTNPALTAERLINKLKQERHEQAESRLRTPDGRFAGDDYSPDVDADGEDG